MISFKAFAEISEIMISNEEFLFRELNMHALTLSFEMKTICCDQLCIFLCQYIFGIDFNLKAICTKGRSYKIKTVLYLWCFEIFFQELYLIAIHKCYIYLGYSRRD